MKPKVFSGVQPTGNIHLGNYIGALRQFVELQDTMDCVYCIVDMHSITLPQDPEQLRQTTLDVAALYMAVGLDPKKATIFVQSTVPQHAELSWVLTCNSYTGELSRMTQFKDKSKGSESAPTGLFTYPLLMAADILLYDANIVPVGNDQKQHIELTRDLAIRFNNKFGDTFVVPDYKGMEVGARIMALDEPTKKMSKSAENIHSRISLLDKPEKVKKSIMKSTTDSEGIIRYDVSEKPGISNLLTIYSVFSGKKIDEVVQQYEGSGYGQFKKDLVEIVNEHLDPIQKKYYEIRESEELIKVLKEGGEKAGAIAENTMKRVREKIGFINL
ncbi:MAG: tryptophan--tRNA ligase [Firmicutes bacterium]|nr:tryptophan--tRNA ligase [Clostridiales bacterium]MBQ4339459.1 tryptophan--tRNA ligase [Bacillota bacterium]